MSKFPGGDGSFDRITVYRAIVVGPAREIDSAAVFPFNRSGERPAPADTDRDDERPIFSGLNA